MRPSTSILRSSVINIFASKVEYPHSGLEDQKARVVLLRGSVKGAKQCCMPQATPVASGAAIADEGCTNQATKVVGSVAVVDARCIG